MKNYLDYSIDDLVMDDNFISWVLNPDIHSALFWEAWTKDNPSQLTKVQRARAIILKLNQSSTTLLADDMTDQIWNDIEKSIQPSSSLTGKTKTWMVAASLMFFIVSSFSAYFFFSADTDLSEVVSDSPPSKWIEHINETDAVKRIELFDGSTVALEPQTYLKYPSVFSDKRRNVILQGEAFFDIYRDTLRPFYVYANDAVIKVLGTSFHVKAKDDNSDVEVIVTTGKVAVYKRNELKKLAKVKTTKVHPLFVTPNQKVVLNRASQTMSRRLTSSPHYVKPPKELPKLSFENASLEGIFKALEESYGIEIEIEATADINCRLSTTLTEKSLYEKLDIICYPLGLKYYEKDARIFIRGKCK